MRQLLLMKQIQLHGFNLMLLKAKFTTELARKSITLDFSEGVFPTVGVGGHFSGARHGTMLRKYDLCCRLLVGGTTGGGFETLRGDKTQSFITKSEAYN